MFTSSAAYGDYEQQNDTVITRSIFSLIPTIDAPGPLLLTGFNYNPNIDKQSQAQWNIWWNYLSIPKTSTVEPLKFGNGQIISSRTL